jgi:ribosomal-protein-alanine N-acetyltransferase
MEFAKHIYTQRLCLRPIKKKDFAFFFRLLGNSRVREYLGGVVGWRKRLSRIKSYLATPSHVGVWVVCIANDKQPIGLVELGPHKDGKNYEVSYQFDPNFWRRGFASEAVGAAVEHALDGRGLDRIIAETQSANVASCSLLRKCGMIEIARVQRFGAEQIIFGTD